MTEDHLYRAAVGLVSLKELQWKKTPGHDRITSECDPAEYPIFEAALVALAAQTQAKYGDQFGEHNALTLDEGQLEIEGREFLSYLVNEVGANFNGAAAYRTPSKNV